MNTSDTRADLVTPRGAALAAKVARVLPAARPTRRRFKALQRQDIDGMRCLDVLPAEQRLAMKAVSAARSSALRSLNRSRRMIFVAPSLTLARRMVNWKSVPGIRPGKPRCFSMTRPPKRRAQPLCDQSLPVKAGSG